MLSGQAWPLEMTDQVYDRKEPHLWGDQEDADA